MYFPTFPPHVSAEGPHDAEPETTAETRDLAATVDHPMREGPPRSGDEDHRGGSKSDPMGAGSDRVGLESDRVRGGTTDLVAVRGFNQAVDLSARARAREDGESPEEMVVPDDFDPADHGLADNRELFARLTPSDHPLLGTTLDS